MRNLILIALFVLSASAAEAQVGESVIVRTQWRESHFKTPTISFYRNSPLAKMFIAGSGDLKHFNNYAGCTDILKKMFEYPLNQMRKDNYITEDFYQFLMNSPVALDARQIVYLNTGKISGSYKADGTSILPNLLGVFKNQGANLLESLNRLGTQWVDVNSSMWVVRGHVPEKKFSSVVKKKMPWQSYDAFHSVSDNLAKDGLSWEFGRAHKEPGSDFASAMKLGMITSAKDAIALGVPFHKGEIFFNVKNLKMAEHMQKAYGCLLRKADGEHNYLLSANLAQLMERLGPADFLHNQAELRALFPQASAAQLVQAESTISKAMFRTLDDVSAPASEKGVFFFNGAHAGRIYSEFQKLDPKFFSSAKPSSFNPTFSEGALSADRSARNVIRPGIEEWGVGDLSEASFKADPDYLNRVIYQTFLLDRKVNRIPKGLPTTQLKPYRGVYIATESKLIAERAQAMGAEVKAVFTDSNSSSYHLEPGEVSHHLKSVRYYTLQFKPETARAIIQDFSLKGKPSGFQEGIKQLEQDFANSF